MARKRVQSGRLVKIPEGFLERLQKFIVRHDLTAPETVAMFEPDSFGLRPGPNALNSLLNQGQNRIGEWSLVNYRRVMANYDGDPASVKSVPLPLVPNVNGQARWDRIKEAHDSDQSVTVTGQPVVVQKQQPDFDSILSDEMEAVAACREFLQLLPRQSQIRVLHILTVFFGKNGKDANARP
jgi:hypothetical protein